MERQINPLIFLLAALIALSATLSASVMLPHDRYYRFQAHNDVTTRKADWIYERLHFDETPVDVALIGTSRMAGGLSAPLIERRYCEATGRKIHAANLAIPVTGRNMHYVIAKEAAKTKAPALFVIELNEIESRRPHTGFIFLADAKDVLTAPLTINLNYLSDLARLPGRQAALFYETLTKAPAVRATFDAATYRGAHFDLTETIFSIDGQINSRRVVHGPEKMEALRAERTKGLSPLYLLPEPLRALEYRYPKAYLTKIRNTAESAGGDVAFTYLPAYGADQAPHLLLQELGITEPVIDLGGAVAHDPAKWYDVTHFNTDGAIEASERFANTLAASHPDLGVAGSCQENSIR